MQDKVSVFKKCFSGLRHVYGTYDLRTGRARQVKERVTDAVILNHLKGNQPYGVYLLVEDRIGALAVDFDEGELEGPCEFVRAGRGYGLRGYIERSKSKGFHVWVFFESQGVTAAKARGVAKHILSEIERPHTEIFPKQDRLDTRASYGNFINAPLFGALVPRGRTVFMDPRNPTKVYPDQWELLENVKRVPEGLLEEIIATNDLACSEGLRAAGDLKTELPSTQQLSYGLAPCARHMLRDGVSENQRLACFRLAVQLKKAGLPEDLAVACLRAWAGKNRPREGRRIITDGEIVAQTHDAYARGYRGCGCGDPAVIPYCQPACRLKARSGNTYRRHSEAGRQAKKTHQRGGDHE